MVRFQAKAKGAWIAMSECKINEADLYKGGAFCIDKEWLQKIRAAIESNRELVSAGKAENAPGIALIQADPSGKRADSVGVLEIKGTLLYSAPEWLEAFGYTSYQAISRRFDALMADSRVKTIVLRVQSPGGSTFGVSELAQKIFSARGSKKIVAYADPYAFSAAYWLASSASILYTTLSGMVGSVGAYTMHADYSKAMEAEGIKITFIKAGEKKVDGNEYEPLSKRAQTDLQGQVDKFYNLFVGDVARNRGVSVEVVESTYGQGGTLLASEALAAGMIDGIYSFDQVVNMELTAIADTITIASRRRSVERELELIDLED